MNRTLLTCVCVALAATALLTFAPASFGAGFDCAKAATRVEKMICASPELDALDTRLATAFKRIPDEVSVADQHAWLRGTRDHCRTVACLRDAYERRIDLLEHWDAPADLGDDLVGRYVTPTVVAVGDVDENGEVALGAGEDCLVLAPEGDDVRVLISSLQNGGHFCDFDGRFRRVAHGLEFVAEPTDSQETGKCRLRLVVARGGITVVDPDGQCRSNRCGPRAGLDGMAFGRATREPGRRECHR